MNGTGLDGDYGTAVRRPDTTYFEVANRETFIVAQIATPKAVRNIEEIAAVPGIDLQFVGPADLGRRLAVIDRPDRMSRVESVERVADAAKRCGKAWGKAAGSVQELDAALLSDDEVRDYRVYLTGVKGYKAATAIADLGENGDPGESARIYADWNLGEL